MENLKPITRKETFLAKVAGQDVETPTPVTREEAFLDAIAKGGGGLPPVTSADNGKVLTVVESVTEGAVIVPEQSVSASQHSADLDNADASAFIDGANVAITLNGVVYYASVTEYTDPYSQTTRRRVSFGTGEAIYYYISDDRFTLSTNSDGTFTVKVSVAEYSTQWEAKNPVTGVERFIVSFPSSSNGAEGDVTKGQLAAAIEGGKEIYIKLGSSSYSLYRCGIEAMYMGSYTYDCVCAKTAVGTDKVVIKAYTMTCSPGQTAVVTLTARQATIPLES